MSKTFDDYYDDLIQKNTSSLAYPSKKLLAHSAWNAAQQEMLDEVIEIIENYRCHDKTYERVGIIEQLKQKYGVK